MKIFGKTFPSLGLSWQIAALAGPLMLQNLSQTLLGVVDTYFVSRIDTDSLAAVGLSGIIFFAVFTLFRSAANATMVYVGRAHGEGNDEKVGDAVWRGINMIAWLSLLAFGLPSFFTFLMGYAAPDDGSAVRELGTSYLRIRSLEIPLAMFSAVVWSFLIGRGDSHTPMVLAWITVLLNIFLDWIFVLGNLGMPQFGVPGAAYATVLANVVNVLLSAWILWRPINRRTFGTGKARLLGFSEILPLLRIGVPLGLGDFIEIASFSAFFALIARLGTDMLAANQIALQYMSISFTLGFAVGMAAASLVAQCLGANDSATAERVGYQATLLAALVMGLVGASYLIAPVRLLGFFTEDPSVIEAGVIVLRLVALYQVADAVGIVLGASLNGAGDTTFTMVSRMVLAWGFFIPSAWVMINPLGRGIGGAWTAALLYLGILSAVYFFRFRSGRWKTIQLA